MNFFSNHDPKWYPSHSSMLSVSKGSIALGLYSLSSRTPYCKISWSLEAARYDDCIALKFGRHLGSDAAEVPVQFRAIGKVQTRMSRLRDFTRSYDTTSVRLANRGPGRPITVKAQERHDVSNYRQLDSFFHTLLKPTLRIAGPLRGESTGKWLSKRVCNVEFLFLLSWTFELKIETWDA